MASLTQWVLEQTLKIVEGMETWGAAVHGVAEPDTTEQLNSNNKWQL